MINILDYDPFDRGQMQYHFHNMCEEDTSIPYPDGLDFYYFITKSDETEAVNSNNTELCALLKYIQNSTQENATTPLTQELHKYVTKIKESAYGRNQYMTWGEYIDEEVEEACKTVREEAKEERYRLLAKLVKDGSLTIERATKELDISEKKFKEKFLK